ncbi:FHA domain-containing protein [Acidianus manzaensis]|uniref:FHA domain-containing protein n=1 Tax=Acidianus manzaensis TaxID=282676 RepID=A0A1W6K0P0_9CREN|nr:FHA domain-containing protein [Acidianus manzaensis]ARM76052.1 hypothetical protein B6F84_08475 [Acidianus manzaensis]
MTWKCPYCGYENSDDANFCINCGAKKPEMNQQPQSSVETQPTVASEENAQTMPEANPGEPIATASNNANAISDQSTGQPQEGQGIVAESQGQSSQGAAVEEQVQPVDQQEAQSTQQTVEQTNQPPAQQETASKYYILFIATPATALNKSKVPLDFDIFENISIGRSPENVIVIPDPEVSRRHAIISLEGGKLYIEDLNSTNGTYIYDGKIFNPVKGKIEIQAGSLIKLGNNTIIRLVTE